MVKISASARTDELMMVDRINNENEKEDLIISTSPWLADRRIFRLQPRYTIQPQWILQDPSAPEKDMTLPAAL